MPKMKTHKGAKARFKVTGSGKLRRRSRMRAHKLEHKSSTRKRRLKGETSVSKADAPRMERLIKGG